jgi:hypothetical protein
MCSWRFADQVGPEHAANLRTSVFLPEPKYPTSWVADLLVGRAASACLSLSASPVACCLRHRAALLPCRCPEPDNLAGGRGWAVLTRPAGLRYPRCSSVCSAAGRLLPPCRWQAPPLSCTLIAAPVADGRRFRSWSTAPARETAAGRAAPQMMLRLLPKCQNSAGLDPGRRRRRSGGPTLPWGGSRGQCQQLGSGTSLLRPSSGPFPATPRLLVSIMMLGLLGRWAAGGARRWRGC